MSANLLMCTLAFVAADVAVVAPTLSTSGSSSSNKGPGLETAPFVATSVCLSPDSPPSDLL